MSLNNLIVTRRGIVDINDVTCHDEVYTAKRRWRKVVAINRSNGDKIIKSEYSFPTLLGDTQEAVVYRVGGKDVVPYYIPRDKNKDIETSAHWFNIGNRVSSLKDLITHASFHIPINTILMDRSKVSAFLRGFFSNNVDLNTLSPRAKLALTFMIKKITPRHDYRSTYYIDKKEYTINTKSVIVLEVDEDDSYCINGLFIQNKR